MLITQNINCILVLTKLFISNIEKNIKIVKYNTFFFLNGFRSYLQSQKIHIFHKMEDNTHDNNNEETKDKKKEAKDQKEETKDKKEETKDKKDQFQLQTKNNYALIVVGRMGHGKSSFTKMIVSDEEKEKVVAKTHNKSVTLECKIYRSNRFIKIFDQDIYVIDTPGIDSKEQNGCKTLAGLIAQEIDNIIIKHRVQIIGIAYVLDIHTRDQPQNGKGFIFDFLELLRIKYFYKNKYSFCVLTKFDSYFEKKQGNKVLAKQFQDDFDKQLYGQVWNRRIEWMSQPDTDIDVFKEKTQSYLKNMYDKQWDSLNKIFKKIKKQQGCLSYQSYSKDRAQYGQILKNKIIKNYHLITYKNKSSTFKINIDLSDELGVAPQVTLVGGAVAFFILSHKRTPSGLQSFSQYLQNFPIQNIERHEFYSYYLLIITFLYDN